LSISVPDGGTVILGGAKAPLALEGLLAGTYGRGQQTVDGNETILIGG
jgi:hypothetical protein